MPDPIITIPGPQLTSILDERGWAKGTYGTDNPDGPVCLHGAVRLCQPVPGDAALIEQVAISEGWGTDWNDASVRTEQEVRDLLAQGVEITDEHLAETFGPQWQAVVSAVRQAASMTPDQVSELAAARTAARAAARDAAAARASTRTLAWALVRAFTWDAAWAAVRDAAWPAWDAVAHASDRAVARDAAWDAAGAVVTWDLASADGPYTYAQRDRLMAPWVSVFGLPEGLAAAAPKENPNA